MKDNSGNFFWASYADFMTAMFIVTLSLFILSYKLFKDKEIRILSLQEELDQRQAMINDQESEMDEMRGYLIMEKALADSLLALLELERDRLVVLEQEYRKLKEIELAISRLDPQYFEYQKQYKRHVLRKQVQFETGSANIKLQYYDMLKNAGKELKGLIELLKEEEGEDTNIKYMLVIEGQASKDSYTRNYELSYARALQLFNLWKRFGIEFDPNRIEVIIAGSGTGGIGRNSGNERLNQRFLIQIIPKIGTIELADLDELRELNRQVQDGANESVIGGEN